MKILKNKIKIDGSVYLQTEEEDDMYYLYNLLRNGDLIESTTIRNVRDFYI